MRFAEFAEDNFGTHPRRPARAGARHPRGHTPVPRYKTVKEFAPGDSGDSGEEDILHKYARMWYNGDDATQLKIEHALDRMGWEIGPLESEEGGAFVIRAGDENGDSYIGFSPEDLQLEESNKSSVRDPGALASRAHIASQEKRHAEWAAKQRELEDEFYKNHPELDDRQKTQGQTESKLEENLRDWFKEKWVRFGPDGKIRGDCARGSDSEGKPKCLPQSKAHALGKKGRASAAARKRREDPNPERRGPARNVATKEAANPAQQAAIAIAMKKAGKKPKTEQQLDELKCWPGYTRVQGVPAGAPGSCKKKTKGVTEGPSEVMGLAKFAMGGGIPGGQSPADIVDARGIIEEKCPKCGGPMFSELLINEKKDACYYKVKSRYKVWPSAYASGALVQCRKKGAKNWGSKS